MFLAIISWLLGINISWETKDQVWKPSMLRDSSDSQLSYQINQQISAKEHNPEWRVFVKTGPWEAYLEVHLLEPWLLQRSSNCTPPKEHGQLRLIKNAAALFRTTRSTVLIISVTSSFSPLDPPPFQMPLTASTTALRASTPTPSTRLTPSPGDIPVSVTWSCFTSRLVWKAHQLLHFLRKLPRTRPGSSLLRSFCHCVEGRIGSSAPCGTATALQETTSLCRGLHRHLRRVADPLPQTSTYFLEAVRLLSSGGALQNLRSPHPTCRYCYCNWTASHAFYTFNASKAEFWCLFCRMLCRMCMFLSFYSIF